MDKGRLATIAIIGRPNVGKSTLFNRLAGRRLALVDDQPGVTRDRRMASGRLGDLTFQIIDTAGLDDATHGSLNDRMREQTMLAVDSADIVLFVMDARTGILPDDRHFGEIVRRSGKPVVLIANKAEGKAGEAGAYEAFSLGLGEPVALSAEHNEGFADLRQAIAAHLDLEAADAADVEPGADDSGPLKIAVLGRPNAGKSTLINSMIGEDRLLTGPEAGITRDSIAIDWEWRGKPVRLFDTAGLRRKARIHDKLEKLAVSDGLRAVNFAEVVVLLIDATVPFEKQDVTLGDLVEREGRAIVIALNKWDLIENKGAMLTQLRKEADERLPQLKGAPVVMLSGAYGQGIDRLMEAVFRQAEIWSRHASTSKINRWLEGVLASHPPPAVSGRRIKIRYATQPKTRPPHFALFGNQLDALPKSYTRYLVNSLRSTFDLPGVPVRITMHTSENPYEGKKAWGH